MSEMETEGLGCSSPDLAARARKRMGLGMKHWTYKVITPITLDIIKPMQLLFVRSRSFVSSTIIWFESVRGKRAWVSHVGQIMADARTISEANWPVHSFTPIEYYLDLERRGEVRLTLAEIIPETWETVENELKAKMACNKYHAGLSRGLFVELAARGIPYNAISLAPMALTSLVRGMIPWFGTWKHIPQEYEMAAFICSGIVDWGWGAGQRLINKDLFASSLSGTVPSPQDILDSPCVRIVAGTQKAYNDGREPEEV